MPLGRSKNPRRTGIDGIHLQYIYSDGADLSENKNTKEKYGHSISC
jgi:hypothetical protein